MSGLPTQIPLQTVPITQEGTDGRLYIEFNWYLFLYHLAAQVFGPGGSGTTPPDASASNSLDLDAGGTDVPQAYRGLANLQALLPEQSDPGASLRDLTNALLLAMDAGLADPPPPAGAVISVTPGASPFTYTAIHDGTMFVSGSVGPTLTLARYGVNVPMGMSDGTVPMREKDQLTLTWSGGTPPTLNFLPNR
ncbi:hypothetical protein [Burkholderia sp. Bp8984]|uniref:hypothetical protein n=1 Tax=Burkholderia sp. Bp8984 TaxID=2184549 RepID=UPI000F5A1A95|nr:hypothetical protein [Burkholderia sp. Bp8984]